MCSFPGVKFLMQTVPCSAALPPVLLGLPRNARILRGKELRFPRYPYMLLPPLSAPVWARGAELSGLHPLGSLALSVPAGLRPWEAVAGSSEGEQRVSVFTPHPFPAGAAGQKPFSLHIELLQVTWLGDSFCCILIRVIVLGPFSPWCGMIGRMVPQR